MFNTFSVPISTLTLCSSPSSMFVHSETSIRLSGRLGKLSSGTDHPVPNPRSNGPGATAVAFACCLHARVHQASGTHRPGRPLWDATECKQPLFRSTGPHRDDRAKGSKQKVINNVCAGESFLSFSQRVRSRSCVAHAGSCSSNIRPQIDQKKNRLRGGNCWRNAPVFGMETTFRNHSVKVMFFPWYLWIEIWQIEVRKNRIHTIRFEGPNMHESVCRLPPAPEGKGFAVHPAGAIYPSLCPAMMMMMSYKQVFNNSSSCNYGF